MTHPLAQIERIVGPVGIVSGPPAQAPYLREWRGSGRGSALAVVRPANTIEVAAVVSVCRDGGIAIVPQSGNTGMAGGALPDSTGQQLLLSLDRMTRIRDIDAIDNTLVVDAGVILANAREAAASQGRLLALSLGSEGSARIGGLISTNAGGTMTVRYGNMREQVLGLEVVLADGRVWNGLNRLRKNNAGYDLKHMFIGAEGTLGIITAAVLRLLPAPADQATALCAIHDPAAALALWAFLCHRPDVRVGAFELYPRLAVDFVAEELGAATDPFPRPWPWYALVETDSPGAAAPTLEAVLGDAASSGIIVDAVFAEGGKRAHALWQVREQVTEARRRVGPGLNHDVSVPVSRIPAFLDDVGQAVALVVPGVRICAFGHVGDGNIHYNLNAPVGMSDEAFVASASQVMRVVHDVVLRHGGSIAAEHGIGLVRREELARVKDPLELDLMRRLKLAFDPAGLMNPGKVL